MNQQTQSPLDEPEVHDFIIGLIRAGWTNRQVANHVKVQFDIDTTDDSIRRFRRRHGINIPTAERASTRIAGDTGEATTHLKQRTRHIHEGIEVHGTPVSPTEHGPVLDNPDQMLRDRGLNPEEWKIDDDYGVLLNEYDGNGGDGNVVTFYQAKFKVKRVNPEAGLVPVRSDGWKPNKLPWLPTEWSPQQGPALIVVCGDQQAPFHDKNLHRLFCQWLSVNQPNRGIILGDLLDFPDISRHPNDPENVARVQECLQAGYEIVRDYVASSPNTAWSFIRGNHDQRLRQYIIDKAPNIHGLHRAVSDIEAEKEFAHSLSWLMRFDELGVDFVNTNGTYEDAQVVLSKNLAVRHGWVVRQGSGASALKTLEQTHHSIIVGHTHRQSVVHHTTHSVDRTPTTLVAVESGCMSQIDGRIDDSGRRFPSYGVYPDWQNGYAVVHLYEDGKFHVSLGTYVNKTLLWNDQRYE